MLSTNGRISAKNSGNNSTQHFGDVIHYAVREPQKLQKTHIYKLLKLYSDANDESETFDLTNLPAELEEKLSFNNVTSHRRLFRSLAHEFQLVDQVLGDIENSETIIKSLERKYCLLLPSDPKWRETPGAADKILKELAEHIQETVQNDPRFDTLDIEVETVEMFCTALVEVGVSKCKVLEVPGA
ncbi:hypothetical protein [Corynebacterium pseudogenitalium]|uniref:hypothetical protein n=1 Tax=Corynebacterium pseudogenitalium TaxID=38303 RepID=UPI0021091EC2|nr:hypothetical protein [Corynebacterium pseudogenitalium]UUA87206.1 hypothetical protein KBP54_10760 [Corynebacterium pseudogenitalium]